MSPSCPACDGTWPPDQDRIADCGTAVAYLHTDQYFPGWCVLVLKDHAAELFELAPPARHALVDEVARLGAALRKVFRPVKVNYALLGNQLRHIHWHLVPRLATDPAPREAVWAVPHDPLLLDEAARRARIALIREALAG